MSQTYGEIVIKLPKGRDHHVLCTYHGKSLGNAPPLYSIVEEQKLVVKGKSQGWRTFPPALTAEDAETLSREILAHIERNRIPNEEAGSKGASASFNDTGPMAARPFSGKIEDPPQKVQKSNHFSDKKKEVDH